jgi:hypothetical protein
MGHLRVSTYAKIVLESLLSEFLRSPFLPQGIIKFVKSKNPIKELYLQAGSGSGVA